MTSLTLHQKASQNQGQDQENMQDPHAIRPIHQGNGQHNTPTPRSQKRPVVLFAVLIFGWLSTASSVGSEILPAQRTEATQRTEALLRAFVAQEYAEVIQQLHPSLRRTLTVEQLGAYIERIFRITGPYQPKSLRLQSVHKESGSVRFLWQAQFKQDRPEVVVLFHPTSWQIQGFVIQSLRIQQQMRKELTKPQPTGILRQQIEQAIDQLMQGYNQGDWARFSQPCGEVLRLTLRPPRFALIRKALFSRFGAYQTRTLISTHQLQPEGHLILRYQAKFSKQAHTQLQVIFARQPEHFVIQWWQLRPVLPTPAQKGSPLPRPR